MASRSAPTPADTPSVDDDTQPQTEDPSDVPSSDGAIPESATGPATDSKTDKHGFNNLLLASKVQKVKAINVKVSDDREACHIFGCCFMPGGELVLCDSSWNFKIKLLDRSLSIVDSMRLTEAPTDIAVVDNNNVIVVIRDKKQVQFVQVLPSLKAGRTVDIGIECDGVAVAAGKIFVSFRCGDITGEIRVYDLEGKGTGKRLGVSKDGLRRTFRQPWYIAVSRSGDKIFVSDTMAEAVHSCLTSNGKIVFQYKDAGLKAPAGLFVDDNDNVLACGWYNNTIQVITSAGKKHKTLLSSKDGIRRPVCVAFRPSDGTLVICCADSDKILVYKMF